MANTVLKEYTNQLADEVKKDLTQITRNNIPPKHPAIQLTEALSTVNGKWNKLIIYPKNNEEMTVRVSNGASKYEHTGDVILEISCKEYFPKTDDVLLIAEALALVHINFAKIANAFANICSSDSLACRRAKEEYFEGLLKSLFSSPKSIDN